MLALFALLPLLGLASAAPTTTTHFPAKRYSGVKIQSARDGLCLTVGGRSHLSPFYDGNSVVSGSCDTAVTWDINPGSGSILAHDDPKYALDAGSNPGNNGRLKVWTSYPGLYQQTWYLTDDRRIAITGGDQCLDESTSPDHIQTYRCITGNDNQGFVIIEGSTPVSSSAAASSTAASSTSSAAPSATASTTGVLIKAPSEGFDFDLCAIVQNGYVGVNSLVEASGCGLGDEFNTRRWIVPAEGETGPVKTVFNNLCLDAGNNPANGSGIKTYTCYDGLLQQTWTRKGNTLRLANNQCLDLAKESSGQNRKPYGYEKKLQTWECSTNNDPYQIFTFPSS